MTDPEQLVNTTFKQYEVREHIARGGMADVYRVFDVNLQREVALKILLPALAHDTQFVDRFRREARTVASLDHPNIVQVYEIGAMPKSERPYIAMQFIDGGSLKEKLQDTDGVPLPIAEALQIVRQIAVALSVAHQANIVHRDIKPSNILHRQDGTPVLVDLGIAAVQSGPKLTRTGTLMGTPHYMSPEQVSGDRRVDGRSDIYSLGIVLYELLSGSRPFEAEDSMAILHKHVYEDPPPLHELRADLKPETERLVHICLAKDPNDRYQTAGEMVAAIDRALQAERDQRPAAAGGWGSRGDSTVVASPPFVERPRRPWWLLALIPLLLLLGAGGAYLLFGRGGGGNEEDAAAAAFSTPTAVAPTSVATPTLEPTTPPTTATAETAVDQPQATSTLAPPSTDTPTGEPTATFTATATPDLGPEAIEIGRSVRNQPITAVRFGAGENVVIFVGGLHAGFAPASVTLAERLISYLRANPEAVPANATAYIISSANPDSPNSPGALSGRLNANGVDLNRNWDCRWTADPTWRSEPVEGIGGPFPFSEPEILALVDFVRQTNPKAVIFWEARAANGLSSPGACGDSSLASGPLSQVYGLAAGYPVADFENLTNQEINGDGTNWLDLQGIAAIAVLLPDYDDVDWNNNLAGSLAVLESYDR